MLAWLRSLLTRDEPQKTLGRSLDAAGGGRRWENAGWVSSLNSDLAAGSTTVRRRAAHAFRNNPHASRASDVLCANIVGSGIRPQSEHPDTAVRDAIDELFARWSGEADASGVLDLFGLQSLAVRSLVEAGESFIRLRPRFPEDGLAVPLQLQLLDPAQIDPSLHRDDGATRVRSGIEFDAIGRRVAFHVSPEPPGEPFPSSLTPVRVPAEDILHIFEPLVPGQIRGLSWLAPALLRLHELDQFEDAALVKAKVAALFCGLITDPDGTGAGFSGAQDGSVLKSGLEPGTLKLLPHGADIRFAEPADAGETFEPFIKQQLRAIAAGCGVTYEQLTADMSGVNYSSARVALIEFRRHVDALQKHIVIHQFCKPIWQRFIEAAILVGALPGDAYDADPGSFYAVKWVPQGWEWVDPEKDTRADILAIDAGLKSRSECIAERGRDPDRVDRERAEDKARAEGLGIAPTFSTTLAEDPADA